MQSYVTKVWFDPQGAGLPEGAIAVDMASLQEPKVKAGVGSGPGFRKDLDHSATLLLSLDAAADLRDRLDAVIRNLEIKETGA